MGSITPYDTRSGKRYRARYRDLDHRQHDKWGFKSKRDAELYLASVEVSKARGEYVDPQEAKATIGVLADSWLSNQVHLKPSSYRPLEIAWRRQVAPTWETTEVGRVRHSAVQTWINDLAKERSATTVIRAYGVLASILDLAVKDRRITSNPARGANLPRKVGKERVYLTHKRVELLASNAGDFDVLVRFMAYTGLRWGEVVGLRVGDLDQSRRRANVQRNATMVSGTIHVGTPKSHEARSVPYPDFLSTDLAAACRGKTSEQLVFGNGEVFLRPPDVRNGWWVRALEACQAADPDFPRITRHDLRHTAASLAVSAGANVKAVQRMLGHASAAMTLDVYADLFDDDLDAVATALSAARAATIVG